jgi:hypothetical protein
VNDFFHEIRLRIEWCRGMRRRAGTQDQQAGWRAEEAGLLDAFLGINRMEISRSCHPFRLPRYQLGLEDGQTLMRLCAEAVRVTERPTAARDRTQQLNGGPVDA